MAFSQTQQMRHIDKSCLKAMQSPIRHLMQRHLENSLFSIAPEREGEYETTLAGFDLIYVNQRKWKFCAIPETREIFVSRGAIELIWCASLGHFLFYTRMIQGRRFDQIGEIDPHSDPVVSNALCLLKWAIICQTPCKCMRPTQHITCFKVDDFKSLHGLARKLAKQDNVLSALIYSNLSEESRRAVDAASILESGERFFCESLIEDLNREIRNGSLCEKIYSLKASLKAETKNFLEQCPEGDDVQFLNRFVLEDCYQEYLIPCPIRAFYLNNWPSCWPSPKQASERESDENVADELCLAACAFLLHHELAHIRLQHTAFTEKDLEDPVNVEISIAQEKEADNEAADWVLNGIDIDSKVFVKRMLGISHACVLTTAMGLYRGSLGGGTHPFSYDRLTSLLNRFLGQKNHVAKGMAFAVLDLHFQNSGRVMKKQKFADQEEALEALCDQLAQEVNRHGSN